MFCIVKCLSTMHHQLITFFSPFVLHKIQKKDQHMTKWLFVIYQHGQSIDQEVVHIHQKIFNPICALMRFMHLLDWTRNRMKLSHWVNIHIIVKLPQFNILLQYDSVKSLFLPKCVSDIKMVTLLKSIHPNKCHRTSFGSICMLNERTMIRSVSP